VSVVVIGAGQAGLAMSRVLSDACIDHVVLERGEVANSWRTERWDSLRLLTPNWMTRLPEWSYRKSDPHGYMRNAEVIGFLDEYQTSFHSPVLCHVEVEEVRPQPIDGTFAVSTNQGRWIASTLIVASGACSEPEIPAVAAELPAAISQYSANHYRNPGQLSDGPVLVVGASASGLQIADEIRRSGRSVTVAVGEHVRLPRSYRGHDIHWWMEELGVHHERHDEIDDIARARRLPSLQLIGSDEGRNLDLNSLQSLGVNTVGKLMRVDGPNFQCSGSIANLVASADLKQTRLLERIDAHIDEHGLDVPTAPERPQPTRLDSPTTLLPTAAFRTVIWATGYRPTFPFLDPRHVPTFDHRHRVRHQGGVSMLPGLFFLGLPFMRRRKSNFIDGVGLDAAELLPHIRTHLAQRRRWSSNAIRTRSTVATSGRDAPTSRLS
jgi:putative flavoprotein involved in K+ transport